MESLTSLSGDAVCWGSNHWLDQWWIIANDQLSWGSITEQREYNYNDRDRKGEMSTQRQKKHPSNCNFQLQANLNWQNTLYKINIDFIVLEKTFLQTELHEGIEDVIKTNPHHMYKYIKINNTNIIFLRDNTKINDILGSNVVMNCIFIEEQCSSMTVVMVSLIHRSE